MKRKVVPLIAAAMVVAAILTVAGGCKPIPYYLAMVYKLHGTVTDAATGAPLESVEVSISTYQYSELTNGLGDYELEMAEGTWLVDFARTGYEMQTHEVTFVKGGEMRIGLDVALVPVGGGGPGEGIFVAGTISLAPGLSGEVSPASPLILNLIGEDWSFTVVQEPTDGGAYSFPFDFAIEVDGTISYVMISAVLDKNGNSAADSGDLMGFYWGPITIAGESVYGIDFTMDQELADGTYTVTITECGDIVGSSVYIGIVPYGMGDAMNPDDWIAAGSGVIEPDGTATIIAREIIDPYALELGDVAIVPGGVYDISIVVDLAGNGPPADPGDLGFRPTHTHPGDFELMIDYYWLAPL